MHASAKARCCAVSLCSRPVLRLLNWQDGRSREKIMRPLTSHPYPRSPLRRSVPSHAARGTGSPTEKRRSPTTSPPRNKCLILVPSSERVDQRVPAEDRVLRPNACRSAAVLLTMDLTRPAARRLYLCFVPVRTRRAAAVAQPLLRRAYDARARLALVRAFARYRHDLT